MTMLNFILAGFDVVASKAAEQRREVLQERLVRLGVASDPNVEIGALLDLARGNAGATTKSENGSGSAGVSKSPRERVDGSEGPAAVPAARETAPRGTAALGPGQVAVRVDSLAEPALAEGVSACWQCGSADFVLGVHDFAPAIEARRRAEWEARRREHEAAARLQRWYHDAQLRRTVRRRAAARRAAARERDKWIIRAQAIVRMHRAVRWGKTLTCVRHIKRAHPVLRRLVINGLVAAQRAIWPSTRFEEELLFADYRELVRRSGGTPSVLEMEKSLRLISDSLAAKEWLFATRIQSAYRGHCARVFVRTFRAVRSVSDRRADAAAATVQRAFRAARGRRRAARQRRAARLRATREAYAAARRAAAARADDEGLRDRIQRSYRRAREQELVSRFLGLHTPDPRAGVVASFLRSPAGRALADGPAHRALFDRALADRRRREDAAARLRRELRWIEARTGALLGAGGGLTAAGGGGGVDGPRAEASGERLRRRMYAHGHGPGAVPRAAAPPSPARRLAPAAAGRAGADGGESAAWDAAADVRAVAAGRAAAGRAAYVRRRRSAWRAYFAGRIAAVEREFAALCVAGARGNTGGAGGGDDGGDAAGSADAAPRKESALAAALRRKEARAERRAAARAQRRRERAAEKAAEWAAAGRGGTDGRRGLSALYSSASSSLPGGEATVYSADTARSGEFGRAPRAPPGEAHVRGVLAESLRPEDAAAVLRPGTGRTRAGARDALAARAALATAASVRRAGPAATDAASVRPHTRRRRRRGAQGRKPTPDGSAHVRPAPATSRTKSGVSWGGSGASGRSLSLPSLADPDPDPAPVPAPDGGARVDGAGVASAATFARLSAGSPLAPAAATTDTARLSVAPRLSRPPTRRSAADSATGPAPSLSLAALTARSAASASATPRSLSRAAARQDADARALRGRARILQQLALRGDARDAAAVVGGAAPQTFTAKRRAVVLRQRVAVALGRGESAEAALARAWG